MPTQTIRPSSTISQNGWNPTSNIHSTIGDDNNATVATQTAGVANLSVHFADTSGLSSATITSFQFFVVAAYAKKPGASATAVSLRDGSANYPDFTLGPFDKALQTFSSGVYTVQQDGSSALTSSYLDGLYVVYIASSHGTVLAEMYIEIIYTIGYGNDIMGLDSDDIHSVSGLATADIDSINGL